MNECCQNEENRVLYPDHPDARLDCVVRVCRVCGLRHFELTLDPGVLGLVGKGLG